jgi:hypothetical protein
VGGREEWWEILMAKSEVEVMLQVLLKEVGFVKKAANVLIDFPGARVVVDVQRNSFDKKRHYLNFRLQYLESECGMALAHPDAVISGRIDSLVPEKQDLFWKAMDDGEAMNAEARQKVLADMVREQMMPFLGELSTLDGGRKLFEQGKLIGLAFSQLKGYWQPCSLSNDGQR